ncbi:phage tail protein [Vitreoscilla massiliensis]|uniref:Phage tail protein n=1 Tax=Vitreoscilla massiliensis TaxID=1689272 RepID=A0ABY4E1B1_9NEIS|nr:phage tail protein [Vitreoscilla massiliensis]UOO89135.1 phage tail protein [Vitreoscilla massiliensis]
MPDFTWDVEIGASISTEYQLREVQFGDGYVQTQAKSLKPKKRKWKVSFFDKEAIISQIVAFFDAKQGRKFTWQSPFGLMNVRVKTHTLTEMGNHVWKLEWEFEEV